MSTFHFIRSFLKAAVCSGLLLVLTMGSTFAGDPYTAYYSSENNNIFWFIQISDIHIGTSGTQDSDNLRWVITEGKNVVNPEFIVASGDLTDATNGWFWPLGQYQSEWDQYKSILAEGNVNATNYFDIPGNHDAYDDAYFSYYLVNSVQGQATGQTQISWTRTFDFGTYHFLGINTADNSGDNFSFSWPWGDYAGLDASELAYIQSELILHNDAELTFVFGHHPVTDTGADDDTWLYYGAEEFVSLLDQDGASLYGYGHTHTYSEELFRGDSYTGYMSGDGVVYFNIDSLGKSSDNHFSVIAVDCNGISTKTQAIDTWPLVMVTTPVDRYLGADINPYAYSIPDGVDNPIRVLVFDEATISQVQYRIDSGSQWQTMQQVSGNPYLWEALWDNTGLAEGAHIIEVQATGSTIGSDVISVYVASSNQAPVADNQTTSTDEDTSVAILLKATDPDGDILTYQVVSAPSHGELSGNPPSLTYSPDADYSGEDSFTFRAFDGSHYSNEGTATITILPTNDPPVAAPDSYVVDEGQILTVTAPGVLSNDTDIDGDTLTASLNTSPLHGILDFNATGGFEYTPYPGYSDADSFTYAAGDGIVGSSPVTVTVTVNPDEAPPAPDPMTWFQEPQTVDTTRIAMTAATASDMNGVEYYFTCTSGNGHDSGWQYSATYVDSSLVASTQYTYTVKARDLSTNRNETAASEAASATTSGTGNLPPIFNADPITKADGTVGVSYNASLAGDASDPDGDVLNFFKVSGPSWLSVTTSGEMSGTPGDLDDGLNEWTVRVEDISGASDEAALHITVDPSSQDTDYFAVGETTTQGTVSSSDYLDTQESDNTYEEIKEVIKAGKWSQLNHTWRFEIADNTSVVFMVEAFHTENDEGDDFVFAYSTDNTVFTEMVRITKISDNDIYQTYELPPAISGTVYVRATDADNTRGSTGLETLYVDSLLIRSSASPMAPGVANNPYPSNGGSDVALDVTLSWTAGAGAEWHDVYFGTESGNLSLVSPGLTETTYSPITLSEDTPYYWRINEGNSVGTTAGLEWSFTTTGGACTPSSVYVDSIITDTIKGSAGKSFGQATVTILDNCGNPVENASITGNFTDDFIEQSSQTETSDSNGEAVFTTDIDLKKPTFDFTVTNIEADGLNY